MICIIPARKGSKRIKNKNIIPFFGKPIIAHVIKNLIDFNLFDKIIVSTNSDKIAKIAQRSGAFVFKRKESLSDNATDINSVVRDVIKNTKLKSHNKNYKVACVFPTSVFLKLKHLKKGLKKLKKQKSFVYSVKKYLHPIERSFFKDKKNFVKFNFSVNIKASTNSFKKNYHDAGQFYLGWKKSWLNKKSCLDKNSDFVVFNQLESHDIDDINDLSIAKKLFKLNNL